MRPGYRFGLMAFVLLFSCAVYAFDINDYLYADETGATITSEQLDISGTTTYELYYVNSNPVMITADGNIIEDQTIIEQILTEHYSSTALPSEQEMSELKALIQKFQDSRDYKLTKYGKGAEELCLQETYLSTYDCNTASSCMAATMKCYIHIQNGGGSCYEELLAPLFYNYRTEVDKMNTATKSIDSLISGLSVNNANENFNQIKAELLKLKESASNIAKSNLGGLDEAIPSSDAFGLCSVSHLEISALSSAESKVSQMQSEIGSISTIATEANTIAQNTHDRVTYKKNAVLLDAWKPKWDAFKTKYDELYQKSLTHSTYVKDSQFTIQFNKMDNAYESMQTRMTSLNFDGVEKDMSDLDDTVIALDNYFKQNTEFEYEKTIEAEDDATDSIIYAKYNVRQDDSTSVEAYNLLVSKKAEIDSRFNPPMTQDQYEQLSVEYQSLQKEAQMYIQSQTEIAKSISSAGGAFGQTAIGAVFAFSDAIYTMPAEQKESIAPVIPPAMLLLIDLAIISILVVIFVGVAVKFKYVFRKRAVLGVWILLLLAFLFILATGSITMYIMVDQSAQSSTLQEFTGVLANSQVTYVIVNKEGLNEDQSKAMLSCAQTIAKQLQSGYEEPTEILQIDGTNCIYNEKTMNAQDCLSLPATNPTIRMDYDSEQQGAQFYTIYQKRANVYGDTAYYQRCEIGNVLN